ncbi:helix-turn-helix domain-containing protein [Halalkalibacterium halodurans]|uniref:BH1009 protein n=2 Tax=Halalkalibacterium halodurans TaxID=86665 RepID=Q9KE49_HALH5|nr:helix-turn-helix domain-containing protein [Halalkalibacterium halodurans]MDY7221546.1 helix-turn-helix domain-containing protein [Halalkalibacterium halodurans]MDY7240822.1 helix-turn-helix domain-containing protein [Halalkalibacterium halodurans]MED3648711.1 helix-turn-helix domain-containing protein [Halalkalibacterium halodurans]MED4080477.1 helix-turn-helix domain-containing protein [Halalkalibacterium halodurans]MED4086510.1 helix-turn-helix domain-containing protein [Halalkalibacteri
MGKKCTGVEKTLAVVSGKWTSMILYHLYTNEKLRFGELRRALPGITQKMLTSDLRELEKHRIIERKVYPQVPPKVEYCITDHGKTLLPLLEQMDEWGDAHAQQTLDPSASTIHSI